MTQPVLAVTIGDPVGIGPEITARTLAEVSGRAEHHGIAVGDAAALRRGARAAGVDAEIREVTDFRTSPSGPGVIDVFDTGVLGADLPEWGVVDARSGKAAVTAVEVATQAALEGQVEGIVTSPINKEAIWAAGCEHLGHTELLGELTGAPWQSTMFVVRNTRVKGHHLRIFFTTRHMSLRKALDELSKEAIVEASLQSLTALTVFGVPKPRFAVAALNPHGGEKGAFGDEEVNLIAPACEHLRGLGHEVAGPIPADSVFHHGLIGRYDGILSHFHDQGHIPAKTFDFEGTISVTVGLPILRTSVDHGTAFDIAGTGKADHATMLSAYLTAVEYAPSVAQIRATYGSARSVRSGR